MRSYRQLCGLAVALDVVSERWTLLIVRDLVLGPQRYTDLARSLSGITPNLLSTRLAALVERGIIERVEGSLGGSGYALSQDGRDLVPTLRTLAAWGRRFVTQEHVREYRRSTRWMMTSVLMRLRSVQEDGDLVVVVDDIPYSYWERDGTVGGCAGASPGSSARYECTDADMRTLLFQSGALASACKEFPQLGFLARRTDHDSSE